MGDAQDRHAGLHAKEIRDRAAAARQLGLDGSWEDIDALVRVATGDKSPSVRLYAAAAAADIACRGRGAAGHPPLDASRRDRIFAWLKGVDPAVNPGLIVLLAAASDRRNLDRIGRILRDPRNVVRAGAVAAIRRMALSAATVDEPHVARAVGAWLADRRVPPDVVLDLVRLVGECGWSDFDDALDRAAGRGRPHGAAVAEARSRIAEAADAAAWEGVWASTGRDVFEPGGEGIAAWFLVHDGRVHVPGKPAQPLVVEGGAAHVGDQPARRIHAPRGGEPDTHPAIQVGGHTWWRVAGRDLVAAVPELLDGIGALGEAARPVAAWLGAVDGTLAARARAIVLHRLGALDEARALLDALCAHKKPRNDLFWWLGRVAADQGDVEAAAAALRRFLDKAGRKAAFRPEAEALLARLGGC